MNREQKAAVIDEIAANITESQAIFAVDFRGITVQQAADLRGRLRDADATLRVVKNSLTERAADQAGVELLKELLKGPTALTFVRGDGALAAKSIADFARTTQLLAFKGGVMDGAAVSSAEITAISRLPSRDVLYGQLVGLIATPLSGLARTLNALIGGIALQLGGVLKQKEAASPAVAPAAPEPADALAESADATAEAVGVEDSTADGEAPPSADPVAEAAEDPNAEPAGEVPSGEQEAAEESPQEPAEESPPEGPEGEDEPPNEAPTDEEPPAQAEAQTTDEQSAPDASGDDEKENT